ncbi:MAG TPA: hypothetical protein VGW38_27055, partial [Chloroflexota bacterium]|nr:hypothetical protein [Chloroflexota bacterium]
AGRLYACGLLATNVLSDLIGDQAVTCDVTGRAGTIARSASALPGSPRSTVRWSDLDGRSHSGDIPSDTSPRNRKQNVAGPACGPAASRCSGDWRALRTTDDSPEGCRIKGNISSSGERIYHMPFHEYYGRTKINEDAGEAWFCTEEEALRAGWRRALR